jgi:hypothetical protein
MDMISSEYDTDKEILKQQRIAISFIDDSIETLNQKGLYKAPKTNFLNHLGDTALWTIVSEVISFSFYLGTLSADKQSIEELHQETKLLKDSLAILKRTTPRNKIYN